MNIQAVWERAQLQLRGTCSCPAAKGPAVPAGLTLQAGAQRCQRHRVMVPLASLPLQRYQGATSVTVPLASLPLQRRQGATSVTVPPASLPLQRRQGATSVTVPLASLPLQRRQGATSVTVPLASLPLQRRQGATSVKVPLASLPLQPCHAPSTRAYAAAQHCLRPQAKTPPAGGPPPAPAALHKPGFRSSARQTEEEQGPQGRSG